MEQQTQVLGRIVEAVGVEGIGNKRGRGISIESDRGREEERRRESVGGEEGEGETRERIEREGSTVG